MSFTLAVGVVIRKPGNSSFQGTGYWCIGVLRTGGSGRRPVQVLQQLVGGELDVLVAPFRSAIHTRDQPRAVNPAEVPVDERIPGLGLVGDTVGEPEVPLGVLVPGVVREERVLGVRTGLDLAPVAV